MRILLFCLLTFSSLFASAEPAGLVAPLYVDKNFVESVWVYPGTMPDQTQLKKNELLLHLKPLVNPAYARRLDALPSGFEGLVSFTQLKAIGIKPQFDNNKLEAHLELDPTSRLGEEANLDSTYGPEYYTVNSSPMSGHFIFRGNEEFFYGPLGEAEKYPQQFTGQLEFVQNVKGAAFETGVDYYDYFDQNKAQRQNTKLSLEVLDKKSWFELGDMMPYTTGLQTSVEIGGASLTQSRRSKSYRLLRSTTDRELFLKRPSLVEVFLGDFLFLRTQTAPGPFSLKNIPLSSGLNKIRIKITDDMGQVEEIDATTLLDTAILKPGEWDYAFSAGSPSTRKGSDRKYDQERQIYSFYTLRGFENYYELGLNGQGQEDRNLWGLEAAKIFRYGRLSFSGASKTSQSLKPAYGSQLRWSSKDYESARNPFSWHIGAFYRDTNFTSITDTTGLKNNYSRTGEFGFTRTFGPRTIFYFNTRTDLPNASSDPIRRAYNTSLTRSWTQSLQSEVSYQGHSDDGNKDTDDYQVTFSLIWQDTPQRTITASYATPTEASRLNYSYEPEQRIGAVRGNASIENDKLQSVQAAQLTYLANRAEFGLDHNSSNFKDINSSLQRTRLRFGSGLYWADGVAAVGRPTYDSFALVTSSKDLHDFTLPINDIKNDSYAEIHGSTPAVTPNLSSYHSQIIAAEYTSLPEGTSLERSSFVFNPDYKSGTHIHLIGKGQVMVVGTMFLKETKEGVPFAGGEVVNLDNLKEVPAAFFTNSKGRFVIEGLNGGNYEIRFFNTPLTPVKFSIPANQRGIYTLPESLFTE